jgi:ribosome-associated protein
MFIITETIQISRDDLQFSFVRSSGPGGQNVNKVASKAVLRWNPAGTLPEHAWQRFKVLFPRCVSNTDDIILTSQRTRDALKNKEDCLEKLRTMLLEALKIPKRRIPTKPTRASVKRRLNEKKHRSEKKQGRKETLHCE